MGLDAGGSRLATFPEVNLSGLSDGDALVWDAATSRWVPSDVVEGSAAWTSYTPTWVGATSNPAIGNGTLTGKYREHGGTLFLRMQLVIGSTTTLGSGKWTFGLPPGYATVDDGERATIRAAINDVGTRYHVALGTLLPNMTEIEFYVDNSGNVVDNDSPMTWVNGDYMVVTGAIEVAPQVDLLANVSAGDNYESWPLIVRDASSNLVVVYSDGTQHLAYDNTRKVVCRIGDIGSWSADETVHNSADDDAAFGIGTNSSGEPLVWVLTRDIADVETHVLRKRSGGSWSTVSTPSLTNVRLISPIINVSGVGLVCHWQSPTTGTLSHGVLISSDNGVNWSQITIGTGLTTATHPVEVRLVDLGASQILGIGRTEVGGNALFQLTCNGSPNTPANWTVTNTTITDQYRTPAALTQRSDGTLDLYYYDRVNGVLYHRSADPAVVFTDPTAWSGRNLILNHEGLGADGGYPHAIRRNDRNLVVFYSGNSTICQVKLREHAPL
jgi:hypothetical protein